MKKQYSNIVFKIYGLRNTDIVATSNQEQTVDTQNVTSKWGNAPDRDFDEDLDY